MVSGLVGNPDFALYLQQVHFLNLPQKRVPKCYKTNPPKPKNPGKSTFSPKTPPNRRNPQTKTRTRSTSLRDTSPKVPNNPQKHQIPSDGTQDKPLRHPYAMQLDWIIWKSQQLQDTYHLPDESFQL